MKIKEVGTEKKVGASWLKWAWLRSVDKVGVWRWKPSAWRRPRWWDISLSTSSTGRLGEGRHRLPFPCLSPARRGWDISKAVFVFYTISILSKMWFTCLSGGTAFIFVKAGVLGEQFPSGSVWNVFQLLHVFSFYY